MLLLSLSPFFNRPYNWKMLLCLCVPIVVHVGKVSNTTHELWVHINFEYEEHEKTHYFCCETKEICYVCLV